METLRKNEKTFFLKTCAAVCFLTAFVSFIRFLVQDDWYFTLCDDFNRQQIPFTFAMQNALKDGNLGGWVWNLDLGASFIQGFSFYGLGSPFFWLTLPFPASWFPYLVGWIYMLKYTVAGVFAYLYLTRMGKKPQIAVVGALLYAFSGFQSANLEFYHFHDVVAFFPLLLIGLEDLMEQPQKRAGFILAVFINCLNNYFFFLQELVFLALYFCFRFVRRPFAEAARRLLRALLCGLLGVGMAAVLFLPSVLYILGSARAAVGRESLVWSFSELLMVLKGFLLPGEAMNDHSAIMAQNWDSIACYLPMVGIAVPLAYVVRTRDWLSALLCVLTLISFSPLLCSGFLLFTEAYTRWWYMFILMAALASCSVLEAPDKYPLIPCVLVNLWLVGAFYVLVHLFITETGGESLVLHPMRLTVFTFLALAGPALVGLLHWKKQLRPIYLILGTALFSCATTALTLNFYRGMDTYYTENREMYLLGQQLDAIDEQYRYDSTYNQIIMTGHAAGGAETFSSTVSAGSEEFDRLFEDRRTNLTVNKHTISGLVRLIGAKYHITTDPSEGPIVRQYAAGGTVYYVIEREVCPIGFAVRDYILADDLLTVEKKSRAVALLAAAVVNCDDEPLVSSLAARRTPESLDLSKLVILSSLEHQAEAVSDFRRDSSGFRCRTAYETDTLVYFSVPYDEGWTVTIDGATVHAIDSGGMMLLAVPAGRHELVFSYCTPGYRAGLWISAFSFALFAVWETAAFIRRRAARDGKINRLPN